MGLGKKYRLYGSLFLSGTSLSFKGRNVFFQSVKYILTSTSDSHETRILHHQFQISDMNEVTSHLALSALHLKNRIPISVFSKSCVLEQESKYTVSRSLVMQFSLRFSFSKNVHYSLLSYTLSAKRLSLMR